MALSNGIYKKWQYNFIESFFYLQLGAFAASVAYARYVHGNVLAVTDTSIGLSLAAFLSILVYHALHRTTVLKKLITCWYRIRGYTRFNEDVSLTHDRYVN
jgi:uncharacterized membrane protein YgdD (TMEM256/DUF423 family)